MWKKEEAERREQLFPPAGEWSRALTPPGLQSKGKAKERDHLLLVQTLLCVLLLAGVLALRQADAPAYQQLREGYHALMEQRGIEGEALLRFAAAAAEGVLQQVQEIAADEFELGPGADRTQPSEAASEDPLWDSTSLATLFGSKAPEGSTLESFLSDVPLEPPLQGTLGVNSEYGWRRDPITWKKSFHTGVDLAAQEGQEVFSSGRGIVTETRHSDSYGNCVRIQHEGGVVTFYCHMQYIFVHQGERVDAGTRIGTAGQTGRTTGPHLHFELLLDGLRYDPAQVLGL